MKRQASKKCSPVSQSWKKSKNLIKKNVVKSNVRWYNIPYQSIIMFRDRNSKGERKVVTMNKIDDLVTALKKKEEEKTRNTVLWILAIIGAVAAVAGIAYGVYRFFTPDYLEDFEEDFDEDFDDYFEDEEE